MSKRSRGEPTFHPISALPMVGAAIAGMLESAEEQARLLLQADRHPYVLDDATVARVIRVYREQAADHWLFSEQLRRWSAGPLSVEQREEVERLVRAAARLEQVTTAILSMGEALRSQTVESLLRKSDAEVGLAYLLAQSRRRRGEQRDRTATRVARGGSNRVACCALAASKFTIELRPSGIGCSPRTTCTRCYRSWRPSTDPTPAPSRSAVDG